MKPGVIHYHWPGFSFDEFLRCAADAGFRYVELMPADVWPDDTLSGDLPEMRAATAHVRNHVESHGLQVCALGAQNDFVQSRNSAREEQVARMRTVCELARVLGDDIVVRSEGGVPKFGVAAETWWNVMYECFAQCTSFLDELEISLAIDNHGLITNDGEQLLALLEKLDHPRVGANLDTMNFRWFGHDLTTCNEFYERLAPRVLHTHFKDGRGTRSDYKGEVLGEGEIDLQYALACLRQVGYDGVYTAEYEGGETDDAAGYRRCAQWMQANLK